MCDAVIVESMRSPGGRYKRGGLAQTCSLNNTTQLSWLTNDSAQQIK